MKQLSLKKRSEPNRRIGTVGRGHEKLHAIDLAAHPSLEDFAALFDRKLGESQRMQIKDLGHRAIISFSQESFGEVRSLLQYDVLNPRTHQLENIARSLFLLSAWATEIVGSPMAGQRHWFDYDPESGNKGITIEYGTHPLIPGDYAVFDQLQALLNAT